MPELGELSDDAVHVELETKVLGYPRCARAVAPFMIEQGWGRINNISGLSARQSGSLVGSVRNVAVSAMTKNLADELGPAGINVTVVHPGVTVTGRTPGMVADRAHRDGLIEAEVHARLAAAAASGLVSAERWEPLLHVRQPRTLPSAGPAGAQRPVDAVLLVTPEYNRSIPGTLKNAIDWASRPWGKNHRSGHSRCRSSEEDGDCSIGAERR